MQRVIPVVCLAALCASAQAQQPQAQTPPAAQQTQTQTPSPRRFEFGFRTGALLTTLIPDHTTTRSTSDPAESFTWDSASHSTRWTVGAVGEFFFKERFSTLLEANYRKAGYDDTYTKVRTVTSGSSTSDKASTQYESTRAKYLDVPLMVRYYFKDRSEPGARVWVSGGYAVRYATGIKTSWSYTNEAGGVDAWDGNGAPDNRLVQGFAVGVGARLADDLALKVVPEIRYTRWMKRTFDHSATQSNLNQLEIAVSFQF